MAKPKLQKTVQFILPQLRRLHMHGEARAASFMKPLNLVLMHSIGFPVVGCIGYSFRLMWL